MKFIIHKEISYNCKNIYSIKTEGIYTIIQLNDKRKLYSKKPKEYLIRLIQGKFNNIYL